jgi:hypothetical protein
MQVRHSGPGHSGVAARNLSLAAAAIFFCGVFLSGCDERIVTFRDTTIPVAKHATWAWRPMQVAPPQAAGRDTRPVISRDVIAPAGPAGGPAVVREPDAANEVARQQARTAIEKQLAKKGLTQISDPQAADFLVDFHLVVQQRDVTTANGNGGYPGVVCGPYGCSNYWGWGSSQINYQNVRYRQGLFVFEFLQRNTLKLAYRAQGQQPAHKGTISQDDVQEMIHTLLGKLNPK